MTNALRQLVETINVALCKLHEIQFSAPWNPSVRGC